MTSKCRISVVIPTYNRRESLANTLRALAEQSLSIEQYEVIVSIDGSEDGTREFLAGFRAPYRLLGVWSPNSGRASACNRGACKATGEILLFLDDDMEPDPDCLNAHLAAHEIAMRQAVMGPIPLSLEAPSTPLVHFLGSKLDVVLKRLAQPGYKMGARDFFSSNLSIRRDLFFEIGAFDQDFRLYGNEDVELACRLFRAKISIAFHPEAVARQHYSKDFAALARDNIDKGRTVVLLAMKHPDVIGQLKLSQYYNSSRKWRYLRAVLLYLSGPFPYVSRSLIRCVRYAERIRPTELNRIYSFALDYCFWLGVERELADNHEAEAVVSILISRRGPSR